MADKSQLKILRQGVNVWNKWTLNHPGIRADFRMVDLSRINLDGILLREADLSGADLSSTYLRRADLWRASLRSAIMRGADLDDADLTGADLSGAYLNGAHLPRATLLSANLSGAELIRAYLSEADLRRAKMMGAKLNGANLSDANLKGANLAEADLQGANLTRAILVETTITDAKLNDCAIYGIAAWNLIGEPTEQKNLLVTTYNEPAITVDNIEVAQFVYLLRENKKLRDSLTAITSRVVLILGRFGLRKNNLEEIADVFRETKNYIPVIFDFEPPEGRDLIDTVKILALLSKFVIVDLSDPQSAPYELDQIASMRLPIQPLLQMPEKEPAVLENIRKRYDWVLETHLYDTIDTLRESLVERLIVTLESKSKELKSQ